MRGLLKELLTAFIVLTLAYLVLINYTGFVKDVAQVGSSTGSIWKTAQGR